MRVQTAVPVLLVVLAAGTALAQDTEPDTLVAPYRVGSELEGGYVVTGIERDADQMVSVTIRRGSVTVQVQFSRRDDARPAYARTEHCNVVWNAGETGSAPTPEALDEAIMQLVTAAAGKDLVCQGAAAPDRTPGPRQIQRRLNWINLLLVLFALAGFGFVSTGTVDALGSRKREVIFWVTVCAITLVGAYLRTVDLGAPLCDSGQSTRAELGAAPILHILTFRVFDHRHPPMTSLLVHLGYWMGGREWMLRLPFLVITVLTLPLVAQLGRKLGGRLVGVGSVAVVAFSEPLIVMPREMKSHALFPLAMVLVMLALIRVVERPTRRNAVILGLVDGLSVWMHYMAPVIVAPRLFALLSRKHRGWAKVSVPLAALVAAPPLYRLAINLLRDMQIRSIAAAHPDVAWGANTVEGVAASGVQIVGPALLVCLMVFAVVGSVHLLAGRDGRDRLVGLSLVVGAWMLPLSVLVLTPMARMLGVYLRLSIPLLAVLATVGADHLARVLSRVVPSRFIRQARGAMATAFVLSAGVISAWQLSDGYPRDVYGFDDRCVYPEMVKTIEDAGPGDVVLVHGYSASLVGFYLGESARAERIQKRRKKRYGSWTVTWVAGIDDLGPHWRRDAQRRLRLITADHPVWLMDLETVEPTWPELERAGRCRVKREFPHARLLYCGP